VKEKETMVNHHWITPARWMVSGSKAVIQSTIPFL